jgi:transcriptional regulator
MPRLSSHDMTDRTELLHGTLETLILRTLADAPRHGYAIARWLETHTADTLQIEDGSLYPALYRMEQRGWIRADWGTSELGRKAKFYRLTPVGRKRLAARTEEWARFADAVSKVLLPGRV